MAYDIEMMPDAEAELAALPKKAQRQVDKKILALAENPRPSGVTFLKGEWTGYCRIRSGDYRIIYHVQDQKLLIVVVKIGDRKDVYQ